MIPKKQEFSTCKRLGFAIAIILGLGALAVVGTGVAGYLNVGSLSHLGQVNSIAMMASGGGSALFLLI